MTSYGLSTAFWFSYALLWLLVVVFGFLLVLIFRQFGLLAMRPLSRIDLQGLDIGAAAPAFSLRDMSGAERSITFSPAAMGGEPAVVVFALPTCGVCAGLATAIAELPERAAGRFVWVDGSSVEVPDRAVHDAYGWLAGSADGDAVHQRWDVSAVPFCFAVGPNGRITGKRIVNRAADVEQLLAGASARGL